MTDSELEDVIERQQPVCRMGEWGPQDNNRPPGRIRTSISVGRVERNAQGGYMYVASETGRRSQITDANRDEYEQASALCPVYVQVGATR